MVVNIQQTLLKIVNTEIYLKRALHGRCTVVRTDLEWYLNSTRPGNLSLIFTQVWAIIATRFDLDRSMFHQDAKTLVHVHGERAECLDQSAKDRTEGCPIAQTFAVSSLPISYRLPFRSCLHLPCSVGGDAEVFISSRLCLQHEKDRCHLRWRTNPS